MNYKPYNIARYFLLILVGLITIGCASQSDIGHTRFEQIYFPNKSAIPRVAVCGNLLNMLPQFDATPFLERFLYGPNKVGKTFLRNPQGMALLQNRLLVCDQGQPDVVAINLDTGRSDTWGDSDRPPRCPVDVTVDESGRVYVADTTLRSVLVYDSDERFIEELIPTDDPQRTFRPCTVFAKADVLYIGNLGDRRIDRWDTTSRRWMSSIKPPKDMPGLIAPTGICTTPDGVLLVADAVRGVVFRVATDGRWLSPIGKPGRGRGEFIRPKQSCCTLSGLIFVSDAGRQSVLVFGADGKYLMEVHERAGNWNGWTLPMGLTALTPADLPLLEVPDENGRSPEADEYVIVSDSLGGMPLTVLGVTMGVEEGNKGAN
ncbi:MAG: hypothetical protein JSV03_10610 [Planctomycetota bacterium]|nr:MAG: hypothetical protein JSV03_10610 [Planctomycetota bacterium]